MTFSAALLSGRLQKGLSQRALARLSGVAQPNIAAFESGARQPTPYSLGRLARGLGLDLAQLQDPQPALLLNREELDRLCQALVRNRRGDTGIPDKAWADLGACFHRKLRALYPGIRRRRPRLSALLAHRRLEALLGRRQFEDLGGRLEKIYPWGRA